MGTFWKNRKFSIFVQKNRFWSTSQVPFGPWPPWSGLGQMLLRAQTLVERAPKNTILRKWNAQNLWRPETWGNELTFGALSIGDGEKRWEICFQLFLNFFDFFHEFPDPSKSSFKALTGLGTPKFGFYASFRFEWAWNHQNWSQERQNWRFLRTTTFLTFYVDHVECAKQKI